MKIFKYNLQDNITQMKTDFWNDMCHIVGTDTETTGLNPIFDKPFKIIFGWLKPKEYIKVYTFNVTEANLETYWELINSSHIKYHFFWNAKFDLSMFLNIKLNLLDLDNIYEGMCIPHLGLSSYDKRIPLALKQFSKIYIDDTAADLQDKLGIEFNSLISQVKYTRNQLLQEYTQNKIWTTTTINNYQKDALLEDKIPKDVLCKWNQIQKDNPLPSYQDIDNGLLEDYASNDVVLMLSCVNTYLHLLVNPKSIRYQLDTLKRESNVAKVLANIEKYGMCVDKEYLVSAKNNVKNWIINTYNQLWELMGEEIHVGQHKKIIDWFNNNKTPLVARLNNSINAQDDTLLFAIEKLTNYQAKDEQKKQRTILICRLIRKLRRYTKWYNTYITSYLSNLIHIDDNYYVLGNFYSFGAHTGRFSSSLQQFPRNGLTNCLCIDDAKIMCSINEHLIYKPRAIFKSRFENGYLCFLDYSQIELRGGAEQTLRINQPDKDWLNAFYNYSNSQDWKEIDLHTNSAEKIFGVREDQDPIVFKSYRAKAKTANFTVLYGGSEQAINETVFESKNYEKAKVFYNKFKQTYPGIIAFQNWCGEQVKKYNIIQNNFGRVYHWASPMLSAFRHIASCMVQGVCADLLKDRLIAVNAYLRETKSNIKIIILLHDEIAFDVPSNEIDKILKIKEIMEYMPIWTVPVVCEIEISQTNWAEKRKVETIREGEIIWK